MAEIKRDSANMYLGMLWWILEPVLYMAVFYLVFGVGLKKGGEDYVFYLLCGLVPWKWLDSTVRTSSGVIISSAGLMRQMYFPKWILPGYIVLANTYKFFLILSLLVLLLAVSGIFSVTWFLLPLLIFLQLFLTAAISMVVSAVVPLIPDLKYAVNYGMTMLFFLSGIFFDVSELGEPVKTWLLWNPVLILIDGYRSVLLYQQGLDPLLLLKIFGISMLFLVCGLSMIIRLDRYYPRVVA